jgi:hypothetical protein
LFTVCSGSGTYTLFITLFISKLFCTKGCMVGGEGGGEGGIGRVGPGKSHKTHNIQYRIQNTTAAKLIYTK